MVRKFEKSPANSSFETLHQLQLYRDSYVNDNPTRNISEIIPQRELLEAIIHNQEHLYENQQEILNNQETTKQERKSYYTYLYQGIIKNNGARQGLAIFVLAAATLIPMCSRQKQVYNHFKDSIKQDERIKSYQDGLRNHQPPLYVFPHADTLSTKQTFL